MSKDEIIYMDHAAATPLHPEVKEAMEPYLDVKFASAMSLSGMGQEAKYAVATGRQRVADLIGARPEEVYFTSGGTESANWAVFGIARAHESKGRHIITSSIEHHAVLMACRRLQELGWDVTELPVDGDGIVDPDDVRKALRADTVLVSIMHANNEIGTVEPLSEIGKITREADVLFHSDAAQTVGAIDVDVDALNLDLVSFTAHKMYGPKGIGALYMRRGTRIEPMFYGGAQESERRPGTENVPCIAGFGRAAELTKERGADRIAKLTPMRDRLFDGILDAIPELVVNGHRERRLPNNMSICIRYVEGESVLLALDLAGVVGSTASACVSGTAGPSHVLMAVGRSMSDANGSLRLSLGRCNEPEHVERVIELLPAIVQKFRNMSPITPEHLIR